MEVLARQFMEFGGGGKSVPIQNLNPRLRAGLEGGTENNGEGLALPATAPERAIPAATTAIRRTHQATPNHDP